MKNFIISISLVHLFFSCTQEKKNFTTHPPYISEGEFVFTKEEIPLVTTEELFDHDVAEDHYASIRQAQKKIESLNNLLETCYGKSCQSYQQMKNNLNLLIEEKKAEGPILKDTFTDVIDNTSSFCTFDNYAPDLYDPLKVFNVKFYFPTRMNANSPGNFEATGSGAGSFWPSVSDYMYLFLLRPNLLMAQNQSNPVMPDSEVLPTKMRWRSIGYEFSPIPDEDLGKYYYHASTPNGYITQNNLNFLTKYADSSTHITTTIVSQNGASRFYVGELKNENGDFNVLSDGHYDLLTHPYFHINTSAYVARILSHGSPAHVVKINGWLGNFMTHKYWEKENPETNIFKEVSVLPEWQLTGTFNHEMGHNLGLTHTTGRTQYIIDPSNLERKIGYICEDMPVAQNSSWCGDEYDNNVMDYNCTQNSFSPCQLKVIHWNSMKSSMTDALYKPGCADHKYDTTIPENQGEVHWDAPHHVIGDIIVKTGSRLIIHCQGSTIASNSQIILEGDAQIVGEENLERRPTDKICQ